MNNEDPAELQGKQGKMPQMRKNFTGKPRKSCQRGQLKKYFSGIN